MKALVTSSAGYGQGGAGQVFAQVVENERAAGALTRYLTPSIKPDDPTGEVVRTKGWRTLRLYTPLRFSPAWQNHLAGDLFDRAVARRLDSVPERVVGFGGKALHTFRKAVALGAKQLELVALNTHVLHVQKQHAEARAAYPIERLWLNEAQVRKTLAEIEAADVIHVISELAWETFVDHGVPVEKLHRLRLPVDPRYGQPETPPVDDGVFRVVTTGRVTLDKGIPVLLEAFARLDRPDARLTIVGGWGTRGMRRYVEDALSRDSRVTVAPGDPLPHLRRADLYVQASYEDGFCYAAAEALACGVPVLVTDQTGMKELVRDSDTGWVVPAGDIPAMSLRINSVASQVLA